MTGQVCFERGCNKTATHKLVRPCCKGEDPLCGKHATARTNSLILLAKIYEFQTVRCEHCGEKTSKLPTVI